ncbi:MAG: hypothetical protein GEU75_03640 [Dehalococcoidia bacterium]|nr:hypothetical protein [Dehalococcoidia bacterium]
MPFNLALADLIIPYLLKGENLGAQHAALSVLRVTQFETASEAFGVTIRGRCEFNGRAKIDPIAGGISVNALVDEAEPPFDPDRRSPVFDLRETTVDFELLVPRAGSAIIAAGVTTIGAADFTATRDVLDVWDALPVDPAPSDFPASGFLLDLILNAPSVRPPFLHPAKMTDEDLLVPDESFQEVSIRLPKLRFRLVHGNDTGSQLGFQLVSAGTAGLDDPGDIGVAELISMEPPYAFIGGEKDRSVGFGFRSAVLDLSDGFTPPAVTEKFGFGDDWAGLYLPEVRFFIAPEGARDFAFEAGVRDLLIGFGEHAGVSGDFEVALINQGSGAVKLSARFFDEAGKAYGIKEVDETHATANLPEQTRMVVDIVGGRAPYSCTVQAGGGAAQPGRLFNIDLSGAASETIQIEVTDASATPIATSLEIVATRLVPQPALPTPGTQTPPNLAATLATTAGDTPVLVIASQNAQEVLVATNPPDATLRWSIDGGTEVGPQTSVAVPLAPGETKTVRARRPGTTVPTALDYYFFFDEPPTTAPANEKQVLHFYTLTAGNISTVRATSQARDREIGGQDPFVAYREFLELAPSSSALLVRGEASHEGNDAKREYNYHLARRRAIAIAERLKAEHSGKNFIIDIDPEPASMADYGAGPLAAWTANWQTHGDPNRRDWWKATVELPPGLSQPEHEADGTLSRPAARVPVPEIPIVDPSAPSPPRPPGLVPQRPAQGTDHP